METIFWTSLLGTLYAYFLYPGVLFLLGRLFPRPPDISSSSFTPSVSLLMPVFNESGVIAAKLANLEQLDYPRDRLKILIVSDGSTDGTLEVIRQYPTH
jgi:cellulose synthase/poly-beta-1,6-N-acetylglucosamine synthase-like glycosyltransferase